MLITLPLWFVVFLFLAGAYCGVMFARSRPSGTTATRRPAAAQPTAAQPTSGPDSLISRNCAAAVTRITMGDAWVLQFAHEGTTWALLTTTPTVSPRPPGTTGPPLRIALSEVVGPMRAMSTLVKGPPRDVYLLRHKAPSKVTVVQRAAVQVLGGMVVLDEGCGTWRALLLDTNAELVTCDPQDIAR